MKKIYCLLLLALSTFVVLLIACRRDFAGGIQKPEIRAIRNWLHTSGGHYSSETIEVMLQSGRMMKGKLNWDEATQYPWQGKEYVDVPFQFDGDACLPEAGTAAPAAFNLVVRKNEVGAYEGAVRTTLYKANWASASGTSGSATIQTYQLLDGTRANAWYFGAATAAPVAVGRRSMSAVDFANMRLIYGGNKGAGTKPGELLMLGTPGCPPIVITSYDLFCQDDPDGGQNNVTCIIIPVTTYMDNGTCSPDGPGGGGPGGSGGGDGGNSGGSYPPGNPNPGTKTPCETALDNNAIAKDILDGAYGVTTPNSAVVLSLNAFHDLARQPFDSVERSISIQTRVNFPVPPQTTTTTEIGTTQMNEGSATSVATIIQGQGRWVVIAGVHSHTAKAYTAPSVKDVYALYNAQKVNKNYKYQFVFSSDNSRYVLTITNHAALDSFIKYHPDSLYVAKDNSWKLGTSIQDDFDRTYKFLLGTDSSKANDRAAYEKALAYSLSQNNMGITLSKVDSTGKFKSIFVQKNSIQAHPEVNNVSVTTDCNL